MQRKNNFKSLPSMDTLLSTLPKRTSMGISVLSPIRVATALTWEEHIFNPFSHETMVNQVTVKALSIPIPYRSRISNAFAPIDFEHSRFVDSPRLFGAE
jgi:hypothetical protein